MWGENFWERERKRREREGGENEKEKGEREKKFRIRSDFQNSILYFSRFFGTKFHFCLFFIVFTIFNKYDAKMNF